MKYPHHAKKNYAKPLEKFASFILNQYLTTEIEYFKLKHFKVHVFLSKAYTK